MADKLQSKLHLLAKLNISVRQQLEVAELRISEINVQLQALAILGAHDHLTIEGDVVAQLPFVPRLGPSDSYQIYQAVLTTADGIGVIVLDLEDYLEHQRHPQEEFVPMGRFQAFDDCSSFVKAALLPQVDPLVVRLLQRLGVQPT